jgi:glycogen synthase
MTRRVLMTGDAVTGVWPYALELTRALAAHDFEVLLAVMGPAPTVEQRKLAAQVPNLHLEHKPFALEWMTAPWAEVRLAGDWLLYLEAKWNPEVVHLNSSALAARDFAAPKLVMAHSCACSWHEAVRGQPAPAKWVTYRRRVSEGLSSADSVVAPTSWMLNAIEAHHGKALHAEVIANVRSPDGFSPAPAKDPVVFATGRVWDESRNLLMLDRAAEQLDWPLMIAGSVEAPKRPSGTFRNAGLLGELAPAVTAQWYGRAAIYAHPAKYDPFGHSVLEAALSGCALVLADVPAQREIWSEAAVFVDANRPDLWTEALNQLIAKPDWRTEYVRRSLERARCFSPAAQATAYVTSYEMMLERVRKPARTG